MSNASKGCSIFPSTSISCQKRKTDHHYSTIMPKMNNVHVLTTQRLITFRDRYLSSWYCLAEIILYCQNQGCLDPLNGHLHSQTLTLNFRIIHQQRHKVSYSDHNQLSIDFSLSGVFNRNYDSIGALIGSPGFSMTSDDMDQTLAWWSANLYVTPSYTWKSLRDSWETAKNRTLMSKKN